MSVVLRRPAADLDLIESYRYYAREAGRRVADRFFARVQDTFVRLAGFPGLGTRYFLSDRTDIDLRFFPVAGFRNYLIFYRPLTDGIEVFRVLHGARDLDSILAEEFDPPGEDDVEPM